MENNQFQSWLLTAEKAESFFPACSFAEFFMQYFTPKCIDILYIHDDLNSFEGKTKKRVEETENIFSKLNIEVEHNYQHGNFAKGTATFSTSKQKKLVICGAERVTGFRRFWNGSETYKLIRMCKSSVISVQEEYTKKTLDKIVVPIDSSPETTEKVKMGIFLAQTFKAKLYILGLDSDKSSENRHSLKTNLEKANILLNESGIEFQAEILKGSNITDITLQYCDDIKADLVMMMAVEEANPKGMFEGSFAEQMILKSHIPVFALRPEREL